MVWQRCGSQLVQHYTCHLFQYFYPEWVLSIYATTYDATFPYIQELYSFLDLHSLTTCFPDKHLKYNCLERTKSRLLSEVILANPAHLISL